MNKYKLTPESKYTNILGYIGKKLDGKIVKMLIAGAAVAITLFPTFEEKTYAEPAPTSTIESVEDNEVVEVPESLKDSLSMYIGKSYGNDITKKDLRELTWLNLSISSPDISLDFLKYCENLKIIFITITSELDDLELLKTIPQVPQLTGITITKISKAQLEITDDLLVFMNRNNLKSLDLNGIFLSPGTESKLNTLDELTISNIHNCDIDFSKLTDIETLNVEGILPYDLPMFLNSEEYNNLKNNGVDIKFKSEEQKKTYLSVSKKLDEIVDSLGLTENSTIKDKINAILIYVLENLDYDPAISEALEDDKPHEELTQSFYIDGMLYGVFNKDTAICGNYTALTEALMDRVALPKLSTILFGSNHSWNMVEIEGEAYYVDSTWLEGEIIYIPKETRTENNGLTTITLENIPYTALEGLKEGRENEFNWYMANPDNIESIDKYNSHVANFIPSYMENTKNNPEVTTSPTEITPEVTNEPTTSPIVDSEEPENIPDITNKEFKIKIGTKEIAIAGGALVGVMTALGAAIKIKKKKELEKRRKNEMKRYSSYHSSTGFFERDPYAGKRRR